MATARSRPATLRSTTTRYGAIHSPSLIRSRIVDYCDWGIAHTQAIHYAQVRPIPVAHPKRLPLITDCSGFATLAYHYAGADDPNGNGYSGYGYTGTLMTHGERVTTPHPGDLILYGLYPGHHVTIFMVEWHGAWLVCSHGQEIGPLRILNHREELAQGNVPWQIRSYLPVS